MARKYHGDKLVEITCNRCGRTDAISPDMPYGEWDAEPFREFDLVYGYGSDLYDLSGVKFDLCEYCIRDIVSEFKIEAESRDYEIKQGITSDGKSYIYHAFADNHEMTQETLDEIYERFKNIEKEDD